MLKARSKKLSIMLVLAMLMTMFAGVGAASASPYKGNIQPYLQQGVDGVMTGQVIMKWDVMTAASVHSGIISLPAGLEFPEFDALGLAAGAVVNIPGTATPMTPTVITTPTTAGDLLTPTYTWLSSKEVKLELAVTPATGSVTDVTVQVVLPPVDVASDAPIGAANVEIHHLAGLFGPGSAHVANISGGQVLVSAMETVTFKDGVAETISLTIKEDSKLGLKALPGTLKLKLPKGYEFDLTAPAAARTLNVATNLAPLGTDLATPVFTTGTAGMRLSADNKTLYLDRDDLGAINAGKGIYRISFGVIVDAMEAQTGDCEVGISGKSSVVPSSVLIGSYADYGYTIEVADEDKEIIAGRDNDEDSLLSKVKIKENIGGSLLNGRTIVMTLPDGVQWIPNAVGTPPIIVDTKTLANTMNFGAATVVNNRANVAKVVLNNGPVGTKGEMEFEAQVAVAADFEGPITIDFSGSAGINDTITVANVVKGLTASVDSIDVKIGLQDQKGADIVIEEVEAETLLATGLSVLNVTAPAGVGFSKLPVVEVDGDITIGTVTRNIGADGTRNNILVIPINSSSYKDAAKITISDVYYSLDRTVPEGAMKLAITGSAINEANITNRGTAVLVTAANCITPAPGETMGHGQFVIDSNIYVVNGVTKIMDVAPYIKDSRTFIPMRYAAEMIGAEVIWDETARTVTLTRDDDVVVFTLGSATYTVNDEAMTADVACEVVNDRAMLPARFVAEAFGAYVGWDPGTRTVLIQN